MIGHERLLAKSSRSPDFPQERETLPHHLRDVYETAEQLINSVGDQATQALGLRETFSRKVLSAAVLRGAFLHDLGKANHQFQRMIRQGPQPPQALRHEWISVWLPLKFPELDRWLFAGCSGIVRNAALAAALGHHLKVEDASLNSGQQGTGDASVVLFCDHMDFRSSLALIQNTLGLPEPPSLQRTEIDLIGRLLPELRRWLVETNDWFRVIDVKLQRFLALVKALVISADVAGSALPRQGHAPGRWVREVLGRVCVDEDLGNIARTRLAGHPPRPFQTQVGQSENRVTFVKAGCGSGKTAAAYLWAERHAANRKLFFCYPTTGTSTEGYRDYIIPAEMTADATLLHSRSEVDLEDVLETQGEDILERTSRIEALATWDVPVVICTADQVLGLVQNYRKALFAFPSIVNAAFVFDEIHQYDERLFGALLRFLDAFRGSQILLMTASLPQPRLKAIHRLLEQLHVISGSAELEQIPRYRLQGPVANPPWDLVQQTLSEGGKVLWVANTVDRTVGFAKQAQERGFPNVYPYHSRYRYMDRLRKHNAVVDAFRNDDREPVLAVTTQVCEVSLDLSADLLVSDLAPVPALIQRMGRLNRRVSPDNPGTPKAAIVLDPANALPYEEADLETARRWLQPLASDAPVSQAALAAAFEQLSQNVKVGDVESAWLDGGPFSRSAPLREAGVTVPVIRAEDESDCVDRGGRPIPKEITRRAIPMTLGPVAKEIGGWRRLGFVFVAPEGRVEYSSEWGARWARK